MVLGEVWEDGSNKIAYGVRRKHLLGGHLDGLMNYPFRTATLDYLLGGDAAAFRTALETLQEHYPPFAFHNAMNFLGTHDTPRILTVLGLGTAEAAEAADTLLTPAQRAGAEAPASGLRHPVHLPRRTHPLLRRRSRLRRRPGPLEPPHLPLGTGEPRPADLVPHPGTAAQAHPRPPPWGTGVGNLSRFPAELPTGAGRRPEVCSRQYRSGAGHGNPPGQGEKPCSPEKSSPMNRFDYQKQAVSSSRRLQRLDSAGWTVPASLEQRLCGDHGHPAQTSRRSQRSPQLAGQQVVNSTRRPIWSRVT